MKTAQKDIPPSSVLKTAATVLDTEELEACSGTVYNAGSISQVVNDVEQAELKTATDILNATTDRFRVRLLTLVVLIPVAGK